jgi:hypothetical protein
MSTKIRAYSQRLTPPFSGQLQIAESDRARAVSLDCEIWEIHFFHTISGADGRPQRKYKRAAVVNHDQLKALSEQLAADSGKTDERILEMIHFLAEAKLPFEATDIYEYWLLDQADGSPLALIFSCTDAELMASFPDKPEWTALPAAVLPVELTDDEKERDEPPVNYRLERLVSKRAGYNRRARWFTHRTSDRDIFPPLLVREDWEDEAHSELCQRYLARQAPRLLMLHWIESSDRKRLEVAAKANVGEVERFHQLYPDVVDKRLMNAMRVEARLRGTTEQDSSLHKRRDGILYL